MCHDIKHASEGQRRSYQRQHTLNKDVLNRRSVMLNPICDVVHAAPVMCGQTETLSVPKKTISELKDESLPGICLQEPGREGLEIADHRQQHESDEHDYQVCGSRPCERCGHHTLKERRQRPVSDHTIHRHLQRQRHEHAERNGDDS